MSDAPETVWACMEGPMVGLFVSAWSGPDAPAWPRYVRADRIAALEAEVTRLTGERDRQYDENVHRIAEQAKVETERDRLIRAGDLLSVCAQTTGGTAGRDDGLVAAIEGWSEARAALVKP